MQSMFIYTCSCIARATLALLCTMVLLSVQLLGSLRDQPTPSWDKPQLRVLVGLHPLCPPLRFCLSEERIDERKGVMADVTFCSCFCLS